MKKQNKNTDKISEKLFFRVMITSVVSILVCITCLCSATWAWFGTNTTSTNNTLGSGRFGLAVTVTDKNDAAVHVSDGADGSFVCTFSEVGEYTVSLKISDDTTVSKGFCTVKANNKTYATSSLKVDGPTTLVFTLNVQESGLTVRFASTWGMPATSDVSAGGTLSIGTSSSAD